MAVSKSPSLELSFHLSLEDTNQNHDHSFSPFEDGVQNVGAAFQKKFYEEQVLVCCHNVN